MKRLYSILLMAFFSLYLMSFTNIISNNSDIHVDVTNDYININYNGKALSYDLLDGKYYKLNQGNNVYQYRVIIEEDLNLILFKLDLEYQMFGYTEFEDVTFNLYLDNQKVKKILSGKEILCLDESDDEYYALYNTLYEYLDKNRSLHPLISPNSFQTEGVGSDINMASSDEYLDNYKSPTYYEYADKTDDDIVKIIPKDYFFREGIKSYCGDEYYVFMNTYSTEYNHIPIYVSQVYVVDIDVTRTNSTSLNILDYSASTKPTTESNFGIYIEPLINEVYIGIRAANYGSFNINNIQAETVLKNDNLKLNIGYRATPKYIVLDNFGIINDYLDEEDCFNCLYEIRYGLDINEIISEQDLANEAINGYLGTISNICSILGVSLAADIIDIFTSFWNLIYPYLSSGELANQYGVTNIDKGVENKNIFLALTGKNAESALFNIFDYLNYLRENNVWNYEYIIEVTNACYNGRVGDASTSESTQIMQTPRQTHLKFSFNVYDDSTKLTSNDVIYNYSFYDYNYVVCYENNDMLFEINDFTSKSEIEFNIMENNFEQVYLVSSTKSGTYLYNVPQYSYLKLVDINGRTLYSSDSRHGSLNHLLINVEANRMYFLVGGFYTNETGDFSIERDTIGHFTYPQYMSYSYTVSSTPNIKCLSYQHYGVYNIYTIGTDSYGDTEIYIYNDMCGLIGYDNDSLNINEDSNNYNAYLYEPIGDDELVYIVCRAKNFYYNNDVELSLVRWN